MRILRMVHGMRWHGFFSRCTRNMTSCWSKEVTFFMRGFLGNQSSNKHFMVCSQCRAGELLCSSNDLSMVHGLTHSLLEENMLLQRAESAVVATSSCSPGGGHVQREETKEYVDVLSAEGYLLQSTEEEKSGISKSDPILKKASQSKEAQILRLCRDASYAEYLEM